MEEMEEPVVLTRARVQWSISGEKCQECGNRMRVSVGARLKSCSYVNCPSHKRYRRGP